MRNASLFSKAFFCSGLDEIVTRIHDVSVGVSRSPLSTLDKLKRIELTMEALTKQLDDLPQEKVKIAQKVRGITDAAVEIGSFLYLSEEDIFVFFQTCEKERREREEEARQRLHRQTHQERNKRALDRALAPPFVKVGKFLILKNFSQTDNWRQFMTVT